VTAARWSFCELQKLRVQVFVSFSRVLFSLLPHGVVRIALGFTLGDKPSFEGFANLSQNNDASVRAGPTQYDCKAD